MSKLDRRLEHPMVWADTLAAVQMGLIYVNPEGPNSNPDPVAAVRPHSRLILPGLGAYLAFALLHLVVNVGALLFSATAKASGLASLWDVGAIGAMSVLTFSACYWVLDRTTPGGAFVIPGRDGRLADPKLSDYIYLAFDTSTTFGPTIETPVCRPAKYLMMLQVVLSIVVLTVLLSRAVNAVG